MFDIALDKPVLITMNVKEGLRPDYETIGKLLDNIILLAKHDKKPLDEKGIGHKYSCEFVVGKKEKYVGGLIIEKKMYILEIDYIKALTKYESTRSFAVTPKEKIMVKEAEKLAREQLKEKEKKDKEKKKKAGDTKEKKTTVKKSKEDVKKTTKKKEVKEITNTCEKWSDLD